jgi:hypothetical protein
MLKQHASANAASMRMQHAVPSQCSWVEAMLLRYVLRGMLLQCQTPSMDGAERIAGVHRMQRIGF